MIPRRIAPRLFQSEPMQRCMLHECRAACCLHGVWIDSWEAEDLLTHTALISPHMPPGFSDPATWFSGEEDRDSFSASGRVLHSTVLSDRQHYGSRACVFLRGDSKCALQVAGDAAGLHPWRFKPFYCVLHPLDLDDEGRITLDETHLLLEEPGSCLRPAERLIPLVQTFEPELRYLVGDEEYLQIVNQAHLVGKA